MTGQYVECPTCPYYGCRDRCRHPLTPPKEPTMPDLTSLARDLATALDEQNQIKDRVDALKEAIRQHPDIVTGGPDKYAAGDATLTISTNRRFDPRKAQELIPAEVLPLVSHTETVIDKDKVKALIPDIFDAAQTEGAYRVGLA